MRPINLLIAFIFMTMALTVHSQEVISSRVSTAAERSARMRSITTNITVQLKDHIQPRLGIRLLSVTTNSVMVANLSSGEKCEMRLLNRIETKKGFVELRSVDAKQETAIFELLKGLHRVWPTDSMLFPTNSISISGEQSVPGYPPQGVGSPEP